MLVKSSSQRISLMDILQDKELRSTLENPQSGMSMCTEKQLRNV